MPAYKVLVCGGRDYTDQEKIYHVLDAYLARIGPDMLLINGGAPGTDSIAREWAVDRKVDHLTLYAKWDIFGKAAGPIRNRRMAKKRPKLVLAFHPDIDKSRGTKDMVGVAKKLDIKTKVFK
jgi:hypothetical protein